MVQQLLFSVGEIQCAIPLAGTSHVIRMVWPGANPGKTPWEAGQINLHGTIIPVLSMRSVFGLELLSPRLTDMLIIAHAGDGDVALWVDVTWGIEGNVLSADLQEITAPAESGIPGLLRTPEGLVLVQDLSLLLARSSTVPCETSLSLEPVAEESGTGLSPVNALLVERAKKLAEPEHELSDTAIVEVLKFRLAYREYALEMQYIREVILTGEITPVPGTPDYISGICVVRGEIISLVDLRVLLGIPEKGLTDLNRVIVVTNKMLSFGILADHITGIGILGLNSISQPDPGAVPVRNTYVKGVAGGFLTVIDAEALFSDPKMVIEDP